MDFPRIQLAFSPAQCGGSGVFPIHRTPLDLGLGLHGRGRRSQMARIAGILLAAAVIASRIIRGVVPALWKSCSSDPRSGTNQFLGLAVESVLDLSPWDHRFPWRAAISPAE